MNKFKVTTVSLAALLLLSGCAADPMGPTVRALPQQGKPFEVFAGDQATCKQYAGDQVRGQADRANERAIGAGLLTTALGAGLGAAVGGGQGAVVGAGVGGVVGTGIGAGNSSHEQRSIQEQYNDAYTQCMYAKGNQIQQPATTVIYQPAPTVVYQQPAPPPTVVYVEPPPPRHPW